MIPSSTNEYEINTTDFGVGDITSVSFSDGVYGFTAKKVGKLYFGIQTSGVGGGFAGIYSLAYISPTADRIAFILGSTVSAYYETTWSPTGAVNNQTYYDVSFWNGNLNSESAISAILIN